MNRYQILVPNYEVAGTTFSPTGEKVQWFNIKWRVAQEVLARNFAGAFAEARRLGISAPVFADPIPLPHAPRNMQ